MMSGELGLSNTANSEFHTIQEDPISEFILNIFKDNETLSLSDILDSILNSAKDQTYSFVPVLKSELGHLIQKDPNSAYSVTQFQSLASSILSNSDFKSMSNKPQTNLRRGTSLLSDRIRANPLPHAPIRSTSPTELFRQPNIPTGPTHRKTRSNSTSQEFHQMQFDNKKNMGDFLYSSSSPGQEYLTNRATRPASMLIDSPNVHNQDLDFSLDSPFNLSQSLMTRPTFLNDYESNFQDSEERHLTLQERSRLRRMTSDLSRRFEASEINILKDQTDAMERIEELEGMIKQLKLDKSSLRKENSRMIQVETTLSSQLIQACEDTKKVGEHLQNLRNKHTLLKEQYDSINDQYLKSLVEIKQQKSTIDEHEYFIQKLENEKANLNTELKIQLQLSESRDRDLFIAQNMSKDYDSLRLQNNTLIANINYLKKCLAHQLPQDLGDRVVSIDFTNPNVSELPTLKAVLDTKKGDSQTPSPQSTSAPKSIQPKASDSSLNSFTEINNTPSNPNPQSNRKIKELEKETKYLKRHIDKTWRQWDQVKEELFSLVEEVQHKLHSKPEHLPLSQSLPLQKSQSEQISQPTEVALVDEHLNQSSDSQQSQEIPNSLSLSKSISTGPSVGSTDQTFQPSSSFSDNNEISSALAKYKEKFKEMEGAIFKMERHRPAKAFPHFQRGSIQLVNIDERTPLDNVNFEPNSPGSNPRLSTYSNKSGDMMDLERQNSGYFDQEHSFADHNTRNLRQKNRQEAISATSLNFRQQMPVSPGLDGLARDQSISPTLRPSAGISMAQILEARQASDANAHDATSFFNPDVDSNPSGMHSTIASRSSQNPHPPISQLLNDSQIRDDITVESSNDITSLRSPSTMNLVSSSTSGSTSRRNSESGPVAHDIPPISSTLLIHQPVVLTATQNQVNPVEHSMDSIPDLPDLEYDSTFVRNKVDQWQQKSQLNEVGTSTQSEIKETKKNNPIIGKLKDKLEVRKYKSNRQMNRHFKKLSIADVMDLPTSSDATPSSVLPKSCKSVTASNPEGEQFQADIYPTQITPRPVSPTTTALNQDGSYTVRNVGNYPPPAAQPSISSVLQQDATAVSGKLKQRGKLLAQHSGKFRGLRMLGSNDDNSTELQSSETNSSGDLVKKDYQPILVVFIYALGAYLVTLIVNVFFAATPALQPPELNSDNEWSRSTSPASLEDSPSSQSKSKSKPKPKTQKSPKSNNSSVKINDGLIRVKNPQKALKQRYQARKTQAQMAYMGKVQDRRHQAETPTSSGTFQPLGEMTQWLFGRRFKSNPDNQ